MLLRADDIVHDDDAPVKAEIIRKSFRGSEFLYTLRLHSGEHRQTYLEVERGPAGLRAALFTAQGSLVSLIHTEPS